MRLAVIQQLPLEYYPPVTNLLTFLKQSGDFQLRVFSVANTKGRVPWTSEGIEISTIPSPSPGAPPLERVFRQIQFLCSAWAGMLRFRPDAVLYFEPHSALPVFCYHLSVFRRARIFIHHHEYYETRDFDRPGMRLPKLAHWCERRLLFLDAEWISQTNADRRRLFLQDHPSLDPGKVHLMPNYPPRSWQETKNRAWKNKPDPLRFVYVGSLSREDTFIEPLANWVKSTHHPVTLDIFGYNVTTSTREWLNSLSGGRLVFHPQGIPYPELPEKLANYHIGLILYRGNTTNFVWNAPNKLFEYLACGLDVWYPPVMKGLHSFREEQRVPRVMEVDFDDLDAIPFEKFSHRGSLPPQATTFETETVLVKLAGALRKDPVPSPPLKPL